jgi:hypothetical protein
VAVVAVVACEQNIMAPGACPAYCPTSNIEVIDSVLLFPVGNDSSFAGYWQYYEGFGMQIASEDAPLPSRGEMLFVPFSGEISVGGNVSKVVPDSFHVRLVMDKRNLAATDFEMVLHYLPVSIDTNTAFADLEPYFQDSTIIGVQALADTASPDTLVILLPADAFPTFEADSFQAAIGVQVRATGPTFASLGTVENTLGGLITRYTTIDSLGVMVQRSDIRGVQFDSFVRPPVAPVAPATLLIGAAPTSRSLMRMALPADIIDSSQIVGAELILFPVAPAVGAPVDTFRIQPIRLTADFGAKSPFTLVAPADTTIESLGVAVPVGSTDSVVVDVTAILRQWQADTTLPRSLMLRVFPEGSSLAELRIGSKEGGATAPRLRVAYVPPFKFGG